MILWYYLTSAHATDVRLTILSSIKDTKNYRWNLHRFMLRMRTKVRMGRSDAELRSIQTQITKEQDALTC